jgi:carboxyl-terminal processing protease
VQKIKGEKGTEVNLTVLKRESKKTEQIVLIRNDIQLADMRIKVKKIETPQGTIGLVSVQNFYRNVSKDVKERIIEANKEKPLAGIVLDLRYNQGGYLDEAVGLAGLFIETGPVVGERDGAGAIDWKYDRDSFHFDQPLVILTSQFSASASEIVAGSLKDYNRAVLVSSTQTFGKGSVQRVISLPQTQLNLPGEIKITTHQYFLAGGASTQIKGVEPDVTIPGLKLEKDLLESAADHPIPWNRIDSRIDATNKDVIRWAAWKTNAVAMLQENSKKRLEHDQDYKDFFDIKKRKEKAEVERKKAADRKPDEPPPLPDKNKDEKDPQATEAVAICADMVASWSGDKTAAAKSTTTETVK